MKEFRITKSVTMRDDAVNRYFSEVSKYPLLTLDEEVALGQRIRLGDEQAVKRLVEGNLRFVVSVAKKYQGLGVPLSDLISEGNIGLIKAARRFDATKGFKFITFAVSYVSQAMLQAINEQGSSVRLPANKVLEMNKVKRVKEILEQKNECTPSDAEIAEMAEMDPEKVSQLYNLRNIDISLDAPINDDDEVTVGDRIPSYDIFMTDEASDKRQFDHILKVLLDDEHRLVLEMLFGINRERSYTIDEVCLELQTSRDKVRMIKNKAMKKLSARQDLFRELMHSA